MKNYAPKSEAMVLLEQMKNGEDMMERTPKARRSTGSLACIFDKPVPQSIDRQTTSQRQMLMLQQQKSSTGVIRRAKKINEIDDYFDRVRETFEKQTEHHKEDIDRLQLNCMADSKLKHKDDIMSDDCVENATVFQFLLYKQRVRHIVAMWRKAFIKAKAAGQFIKFVGDVKDKIYLLGIAHNIKDMHEELNLAWFIIPPDSRFSQVWSLVIAALLIYTATYMPYKTCFVDESTLKDEIIDWFVDVCFMFDILVNFLQATENSDGSWIIQPKIIARNYLKSWFTFDLVSVIPFQLIEHFFQKDEAGGGGDMSSYNQLIRLARLPRLYRMTKLMRLVKIVKSAKKNKHIQRLLKNVKLNSAISRMIQGMITALLLTHVFACFWYLTAKFSNFSEDTWIFRIGIHGSDRIDYYIWALYWATQTITTVGYGDIPAFTNTEIIFSFIWMLVGVAFYSFIIGNFASLIQGSSQIQKSISYRVKGLSELSRKAKLPFETSKQIKQFIEANVMALFTQDEDSQLIKTLPPVLRDEILLITYGELIDRIDFFKSVQDHDFMWKLLHCLTDIKFEKGDVLYWRGDDAECMYFILSGKVKLYADGNPFVKYQSGGCFGDQDMLLNLPRDSKAVAITHLHLKALNTTQFEEISQFAQETSLRMIVEARQKRDKHWNLIKKVSLRVNRKSILITQIQQSQSQQIPFPLEAVDKIGKEHASKSLGPINLSQSQKIESPDQVKRLSTNEPHTGTTTQVGGVSKMGNRARRFSELLMPSKQHASMKLQVDVMETIVESHRSQSVSNTKRASQNSSAPSEFADNQSSGNKKGPSPAKSKSLSPKQKIASQYMKRSFPQKNQASRMTRKQSIIDKRLNELRQRNSNMVGSTISNPSNNSSSSMSKSALQRLGLKNLSILTKSGGNPAVELANIQTSAGPQIEVVDEESFEEEKYSSSAMDKGFDSSAVLEDSRQNAALTKKKSKLLGLPEMGETDQSVDDSIQQPGLKQNDSNTSSSVDHSMSFNKGPEKMLKRKSDISDGIDFSHQSSMKSGLSSKKRKNTRKKQYSKVVDQRVSLSNKKLSNALLISSRVKHAQKNKQLNMLSQRIKKQSQDQLGNSINYLNREGNGPKIRSPSKQVSEEQAIANQESPELDNKINALKKLEDIREESEFSDSEDSKKKGARRTLLDKVVGDVFGKEKQRLYEMFPTIAVITVPKMPIITPKGDEIILRKKYNANMNVLNEAFEQKAELYDTQWQESVNEPIKSTSDKDTSKKASKKFIQNLSDPMMKSFDPKQVLIVPKYEPTISATPLLRSTNVSKVKSLSNVDDFAKAVGRKSSKDNLISVNELSDSQKYKVNSSPYRYDKNDTKSMLKLSSHRSNSCSERSIRWMGMNSSSSRKQSPHHMNEKYDLKNKMVSAQFLDLNGRLKKKSELKYDFASPSVLQILKRASRSLSQMANQRDQILDEKAQRSQIKIVNKRESSIKLHQSTSDHQTSQKNLVSLEDGEMSEVISANADVKRTSTESIQTQSENESSKVDLKRRAEILGQFKSFLESEELQTARSTRRNTARGAGSSLELLDAVNKQAQIGGVEFFGNESMQGIVRFNMDSGLLGLNTFEVISMMDQTHQALGGVKKKLKQVSQNIDAIEKKQSRLEINADKMMEKMRAYRALKQEVRGLNYKRTNSKDQRGVGRKGRQLKFQQMTSNLFKDNSNNPPQEQSQADFTMQHTVIDTTENSMTMPIHPIDLMANRLSRHRQRSKDQSSANLLDQTHAISLVEGERDMSAERIAKMVRGNSPALDLTIKLRKMAEAAAATHSTAQDGQK